MKTSFHQPNEANWKDFIPESEHVLSPSYGGGYFFVEYMIDAISKIYQFDAEGNNLGEIELPGVEAVGFFLQKR